MFIFYILLSLLLLFYALHRFYIIILYKIAYKNKNRISYKIATLKDKNLPYVTIQIPLFNESDLARRILNTVCDLYYPNNKLQIQVLDDSTDHTSKILKAEISKIKKSKNLDIQYLHRDNRFEFKAGALKEGLKKAKGDILCIFDADFVPDKDFLLKTIPYFENKNIAIVQTMWSYFNYNKSILTKFQKLQLDAHFILEHTARCYSNFFINFNGTAGLLRKTAIIEAGNWSFKTLTEDLDLSYKIQLLNYKIMYLPFIQCNSELPEDILSFKQQQFRWTKGTIQTAFYNIKNILKSKINIPTKIEACVHLLAPLGYIYSFVLAIITPLVIFYNQEITSFLFIFELSITISIFISLGSYIYYAQKQVSKNWYKDIIYFPIFFFIGLSLMISNTVAILEVLIKKKNVFYRTPKYNYENYTHKLKQQYIRYFLHNKTIVFLEIVYFIYLNYILFYTLYNGVFYKLPLFIIFLMAAYYHLFLHIKHYNKN